MDIVWGAILVILTLVSWLGQIVSASLPTLAARLTLIEPESDVDPAFYVDARGEAIWDALVLWALPVAGLLLMLDSTWWAYFGLSGGGMYLYFAGRGIVARMALRRREIRIGDPGALRLYYVFLTLWGLAALGTIVMAVQDLSPP